MAEPAVDRPSLDVRDNPGEHRYEVHVDGELGGFAVYRRDGDRITFVHTEVDDAHEGKGVGSELVRRALDDVRARGLRVVAECPFVRGWIARHDRYADLLAP